MNELKFLLENMFDNNKNRMLRIVSDGLEKAKSINDQRLVALIENDLKLINKL